VCVCVCLCVRVGVCACVRVCVCACARVVQVSEERVRVVEVPGGRVAVCLHAIVCVCVCERERERERERDFIRNPSQISVAALYVAQLSVWARVITCAGARWTVRDVVVHAAHATVLRKQRHCKGIRTAPISWRSSVIL
jgi:hypothetical protein